MHKQLTSSLPPSQVLARAAAASGLFEAAPAACAIDGDAARPALLLSPCAGAAEALLEAGGGAAAWGGGSAAAPGGRRPRASSTASDASARSAASAGTVARQTRALAQWRLRLLPCLPSSNDPASPVAKWPAHLAPGWNNGRARALLVKAGAEAPPEPAAEAPAPPTPHYNAGVLRDVCLRRVHGTFAAALAGHDGAAAAVAVLKDWWAGRWCV